MIVNQVTTLTTRVQQLESRLLALQETGASKIAVQQQKIHEQLRDYRELLDVKIKMESELAMYQSMLESGESR